MDACALFLIPFHQIVNRKGPKTVWDRPGANEPNFSAEMLEEMLSELNRLIAKYNSPEWYLGTANRLVVILTEHRGRLQTELNEVNAGLRKLTDRDFLGPKTRRERALRKRAAGDAGGSGAAPEATAEANERARYFASLEQKRLEDKRSEVARAEGAASGNALSHKDYVKNYIETTKVLVRSRIAELGPQPASKLPVE